MSFFFKILKNRRLLFAYVKKYTYLYCRTFIYRIKKVFRINAYQRTKQRFTVRLSNQQGGVARYVREHMSHAFLCVDIDTALDELRKDENFISALSITADKVCRYRFLILNEFWNNILCVDGHIKWNYDLKSGFSFPAVHYSKIRKKIKPGIDIKNCWELSRMQYLFSPALLYRLTEDDKYAQFVKEVLIDWTRGNRYEEGPNWSPSMETGIRAANMMLAFQLISSSDVIDDDFAAAILASAHLHYKFIIKNEENIGGRTSNHYLGGLIGLLSIVATFPFLPYAPKILSYVKNSLEIEIQKQILPDGGSFEGSSAYQQLVGEIFVLACVLVKNSGMDFSDTYYNRLSKALEYASTLVKPDGTFTQTGDNDGGHIFRLIPVKVPDNSFFISLTSHVLVHEISLTSYCKEASLFYGATGLLKTAEPWNIRLFPDTKQAIYRNDSQFVHFNASDAHIKGRGHMHNDKLSFEISCLGRNFISDPGSGVYTSYPQIRNKLRSVASHSTVQVAKSEQDSFPKNLLFFTSRDSDITLFEVSENMDEVVFSGTVKRSVTPVYTHKRTVRIGHKGFRICISDIFSETDEYGIVWRAVLHPDVSACTDGDSAVIHNNGVSVQLSAFGDVRVCDGTYSRNYGQWEKTKILEVWMDKIIPGYEYSCIFELLQ